MLLAKRGQEIYALDEDGAFNYNFKQMNYDINQYKIFMRKTGLFDLISNRIVNNLVDYVLGVEAGLSSNGRKNRGGRLMENLIEKYLQKYNLEYYKEMTLDNIEQKWGISFASMSNQRQTTKRFDFVVKTNNYIYGIEANFYASGGSKLNETARSYKMIALETKNIQRFKFVWFTDGKGWFSAKNNLKETFDVLDDIYNIKDIENGIFKKLFI